MRIALGHRPGFVTEQPPYPVCTMAQHSAVVGGRLFTIAQLGRITTLW
jgi:hypothetical protein